MLKTSHDKNLDSVLSKKRNIFLDGITPNVYVLCHIKA
jgi:hypothetical protein